MSATATSKLVNHSTTGATSYTTASWTPVSNKLYLVTVVQRTAISTDPNLPTLTGNGITWVSVDSVVYDTTSSSRRRLTVFRGLDASPTTGTLVIDCGGQAHTNCDWAIDEWSGMDTSGTSGSGAIVQSATNFSGGASTLTATLSAFSSVNNATFGAAGTALDHAITEAGWTQLSDQIDSVSTAQASAFIVSNDTTVTFTQASPAEFGVIGIEIKAAATGTPTNLFFF